MPKRSYAAAAGYRYGFNGKENDNDMKGLGNQQDYGMRIYDPRLGRFLSVDPLSAKFPFYTPYSFAGNKPIQCIDLDGAEEAIPFLQSSAFDRIVAAAPDVSYVRGKKGDKLATSLPDERGQFEKFLMSMSPIQMAPVEPAYIAQAINFGNSIGAVVYDYEESLKGNVKQITNGSEALRSNGHTVYLNIIGSSEIGQAIIENLRGSHGLKDISDGEIEDFISTLNFKFEPGKDYSNLFWKQEGGKPQVQLIGIGPAAIPFATSTIIVLPPTSGSAVNGKQGSITVSTVAISKELAASLAPALLQMSKERTQKPDDGYSTTEELAGKRKELQNYLKERNGKGDSISKALKKKLEKNEKILGERNKQKRSSN